MNGPTSCKPNQQLSVNLTHVLSIQTEDASLKEQLQKFWEVESCGEVSAETLDSKSFVKKIEFDGDRYSVPLPWKPNMREVLPDNLFQCKKRLGALIQRLKDNPEQFRRYNDVIKEQESEGIIEKCTDYPNQGEVHYLPHHCIINEDKETTKFRVVYDASSNKPSLNDCLEKGENLVPLMMDILIRFRAYKIALVSDIKKAFLNVAVQKQDRNFLRFLWLKDIDDPTQEMQMYRFTRVLFGMNAALYLLLITVWNHLTKYTDTDPELVYYILRCLYVDDKIGGCDDDEEAFEIYKKTKEIFLQTGLELRKWISNDIQLQNRINDNEMLRSEEVEKMEIKVLSKVLGIQWNTRLDELKIKTRDIYDEGKVVLRTTRNELRMVAKIHDIIGVVSPVVILFKVFFQKLLEAKLGWDKKLPALFESEWDNLLELLADDSLFKVNRYYFGNNKKVDFESFTLHGFCDASEIAYGAVVYIVGGTRCTKRSEFVVSKTKVAPIRKMSIPRLELCACELLSNLMFNVVHALTGVMHIDTQVCWSDALDVLHWIKKEKKRRKVFVENRVQKIRKNVPPVNWRYCPTGMNPADIASRGMKTPKVVQDEFSKWIAGPEFIRQDVGQWPEDLSSNQEGDEEADVDDKVSVNCSYETENKVVCLYTTDDATKGTQQIIKVFKGKGSNR